MQQAASEKGANAVVGVDIDYETVGSNGSMGVHQLDEFLKKADHPKWTGEIVFQPMAPHCWGPPRNELMAKMAAQITKSAPAGADVTGWKY